jgi:hypothetical protein
MIDFETDLRDRLDRATADVAAPPDLLPTIERRITARGRRTTALRVAGAVAVVALASGIALVATGDDGGDAGPPVATDPTTDTTEAGTTTTAPLPTGWAGMADAPIAERVYHLVLAMDDEVLVRGGMAVATPEPGPDGDALPTTLADGAVYEPATDTWRTVPDAPLPGSASGVWTGTEAILVSGGPPLSTPEMAGGPPVAAAFDPATDTWRPLAAPPEDLAPGNVTMVWTGTHVVALQTGTAFPEDAASTTVGIYDPATDTWTTGATPDVLGADAVAVWTGTEVLVVASVDSDPATDAYDDVVVRAYDPATDTWRNLPWGLSGTARSFSAVVWTGDRLFVGGGLTFGGEEEARAREAALLDPATGTWTPTTPAPTGIFGPEQMTAVWSGDRVVIVGAGEGGAPLAVPGPAAALTYDPATDTWSEGGTAPGDEYGAGWVWAAGRVVVPLGAVPAPFDEDGTSGCCPVGIPGGATYVP